MFFSLRMSFASPFFCSQRVPLRSRGQNSCDKVKTKHLSGKSKRLCGNRRPIYGDVCLHAGYLVLGGKWINRTGPFPPTSGESRAKGQCEAFSKAGFPAMLTPRPCSPSTKSKGGGPRDFLTPALPCSSGKPKGGCTKKISGDFSPKKSTWLGYC